MVIDLLGSPNSASFDLRSLKYVSGGGAAMPQAVAERLQAEFDLVVAEGYGLTRATMEWFWGHYADAGAATNPHAAPLIAADLSRLPPALIQVAEYDPLRDEGVRYAQRLAEAHVRTDLSQWEGMNHGFLFWVNHVDAATEAMREANAWLRRIFG